MNRPRLSVHSHPSGEHIIVDEVISVVDQYWFSKIRRPGRYLGNEINSVKKDLSKTEVSVALVFPDAYEIGMSHLGLKILYDLLNKKPWIACERVFSPWTDMEESLRHEKIPLASLESSRPLSKFDIVGFSIQHELCYTNILNILDLSGIPFLSSERDGRNPLLIAGGPACFNPEPVADFFDLMVIGDGEAAALDICRTVRESARHKSCDRENLLREMLPIQGVYIPSFFHEQVDGSGNIRFVESSIPGYDKVRRAILPDIDSYSYPERQVVPFTEPAHDRVSMEIARGCTRGCRFCQAGMIYRPVRERNLESILKKSENALRLTGYEDLSLLSLSSGDYSCIGELLKSLMDRQSEDKTAVSLPSLRIDSLDKEMMEQIKRVRKTGFTLAVEAGSDRLRKMINKGLTQEEILQTARKVYGAGWKLIKLYFMIGLPFEEDDDIKEIIVLAKKIAGLAGKRPKKAVLNVSISTFVPKAHTPFMWMPQISIAESRRKIKVIQRGLYGGRIKVKWNQPELSWLEGVFARGDRKLSKAVWEAWKLGARFDAWGDQFRMDLWEKAFSKTGIDPDLYLSRERSVQDILPWDHIDSGVKKSFLKKELQRATEAILTPDCREKCLECGVCDHQTIDPVLHEGQKLPAAPERDRHISPELTKKYRITFRKTGSLRHLGHLEVVRMFIRAFRRAELKMSYSNGFHPMPKISFYSALPVGTASLKEVMDIKLIVREDVHGIQRKLSRQLPKEMDIVQITEVPVSGKKLRLKESQFLITAAGIKFKKDSISRFLKSEKFPVVKVDKKGEHEIDARPLVSSLTLVGDDKIEIAIKHTDGRGLRPVEIVKAVFCTEDDSDFQMETLKTGQILE